jgi:hypothetical protein
MASLLAGIILTKMEEIMEFLNAKKLVCFGLVSFVFAGS